MLEVNNRQVDLNKLPEGAPKPNLISKRMERVVGAIFIALGAAFVAGCVLSFVAVPLVALIATPIVTTVLGIILIAKPKADPYAEHLHQRNIAHNTINAGYPYNEFRNLWKNTVYSDTDVNITIAPKINEKSYPDFIQIYGKEVITILDDNNNALLKAKFIQHLKSVDTDIMKIPNDFELTFNEREEIRNEVKALWEESSFKDLMKVDSGFLKSLFHGLNPSLWTDKFLRETNDIKVIDLFKNYPPLFSYFILTSKNIADKLEKELSEVNSFEEFIKNGYGRLVKDGLISLLNPQFKALIVKFIKENPSEFIGSIQGKGLGTIIINNCWIDNKHHDLIALANKDYLEANNRLIKKSLEYRTSKEAQLEKLKRKLESDIKKMYDAEELALESCQNDRKDTLSKIQEKQRTIANLNDQKEELKIGIASDDPNSTALAREISAIDVSILFEEQFIGELKEKLFVQQKREVELQEKLREAMDNSKEKEKKLKAKYDEAVEKTERKFNRLIELEQTGFEEKKKAILDRIKNSVQ